MGKGETYEIYGPEQTDIRKNPEILSSDFSNRAEKIGITVPGPVEQVTSDIVCAQEGERIALESSTIPRKIRPPRLRFLVNFLI